MVGVASIFLSSIKVSRKAKMARKNVMVKQAIMKYTKVWCAMVIDGILGGVL